MTIIGNLTHSPETRTTQNGIMVTTFTVAVNQRRRSQGQEEHADFFKVTAWRGLGEVCGKYLKKGFRVCIVGPVTLEEWTGRDGTNKAALAITAEDMEILTSKAEANGDIYEAQKKEQEYIRKEREAIQNEPPKYVEVTDDDLPF